MKILLVSSNAAQNNTIREILEFEQYTVEEAERCITCLHKLKTERGEYGLLLIDLVMPQVFYSLETIEKINAHFPEVPVVLVHGGDLSKFDMSKYHLFHILELPIYLEELFSVVEAALEK